VAARADVNQDKFSQNLVAERGHGFTDLVDEIVDSLGYGTTRAFRF